MTSCTRFEKLPSIAHRKKFVVIVTGDAGTDADVRCKGRTRCALIAALPVGNIGVRRRQM
jgi:hypothetical protein